MSDSLLSGELLVDVGVIMLVDILVAVYMVNVCSPVKERSLQSKIFCNLTGGRW